ncbi:MAG: alpha/beta fold hydrolase [Chloroflexota bacterium]
MRLHFQAQGQGHPLLILHGFLGSLDNWRAMSKRLAKQFRVYALDLRNHGLSPHSDVMNYPVMARDVGELIAAEGLMPPYILGHSMGGKVAMQFALQYPQSVAKLVVVDIAPKAYASSHMPLLLALRAVDLLAYRSFGEIGVALAGAVTDAALRDFLLKNLTRDADQAFRWRIALDEIIRNYDSLTQAITADRPFDKPACFIRGGRSSFVNDRDGASLGALFPRAEIRTIAGAGHWLHFDAPEEFYSVVSNFLATPT